MHKHYDITIINYWSRLSKISRFVGGEKIHYLPMPKAEGNNLFVSHRPITILIFREPSSIFVLSFSYIVSYKTLELGTASFSHKRFACSAKRAHCSPNLKAIRILRVLFVVLFQSIFIASPIPRRDHKRLLRIIMSY